jgi:hypothetical protein
MCATAIPGTAVNAGNHCVIPMVWSTLCTSFDRLRPLVLGDAPSLWRCAINYGHVIDRALWVLLRPDEASPEHASITA